jgi:hypothetical protein
LFWRRYIRFHPLWEAGTGLVGPVRIFAERAGWTT